MKENKFELTEEEVKTSIEIYGKVIKCVIAPYHTPWNVTETEVGKLVAESIITFPERIISAKDCKFYIKNLVEDKSGAKEVLIITSNTDIISDMIRQNVRLLDKDGELHEIDLKPFLANVHDIRNLMGLMNNDNFSSDLLKDQIEKICNCTDKNQPLKDEELIGKIIDSIGDPLIVNIMERQFEDAKRINNENK